MSLTTFFPDNLLIPLRQRVETLWINPAYQPSLSPDLGGSESMEDAAARLERNTAVLQRIFPQLQTSHGRVESELRPIPDLQAALLNKPGGNSPWFLKSDHALPVAGSVKARGGFHEILALAELLLDQRYAGLGEERPEIDSEEARSLFARYTVAVGSTGNLGLGIGMISAALGFRAVVHMSCDAKQWKKDRLRCRGIDVVEHEGDYARAVAAGRDAAERDPYTHFVDDENSISLFLGYAAAAFEIEKQLADHGRHVDEQHPLIVYLPCGVGGAPGGITFGLKQRFGKHVHCFFAEPIESPCMLVQLASGQDSPVSVYDIGLSNRTEADGLAVGLASPLVAPMMRSLLAGVFTVDDNRLFKDVHTLANTENILIEPSAAAGFNGPRWLLDSPPGQSFQTTHHVNMENATHVLWSTGGSLVPEVEHHKFQQKGKQLLGDQA